MASTLVTAVVGSAVTASFGGLGYIVRTARTRIETQLSDNRKALHEELKDSRESLDRRLDDIETGMSRSMSQVLAEVRDVKDGLVHLDRRVTRLESWRELLSLPHEMRDRRQNEGDQERGT